GHRAKVARARRLYPTVEGARAGVGRGYPSASSVSIMDRRAACRSAKATSGGLACPQHTIKLWVGSYEDEAAVLLSLRVYDHPPWQSIIVIEISLHRGNLCQGMPDI